MTQKRTKTVIKSLMTDILKKIIKPPIPDGYIQWTEFGKWLSCQKNCAISLEIVTAPEDWCKTNTKYVVWKL